MYNGIEFLFFITIPSIYKTKNHFDLCLMSKSVVTKKSTLSFPLYYHLFVNKVHLTVLVVTTNKVKQVVMVIKAMQWILA